MFLTVGFAALLGIAGIAQAAGDAQAGKTKAASCAACHGANGEGKKPYPALAGKAEGDIVQALQEYKSGKRANPIMKGLANPLSEQDMANLGAYYASLKAK
jgi:cytochrome c553